MGVLDRVKFWKRDDPGRDLSYDLGAQNFGTQDPNQQLGQFNPDPMPGSSHGTQFPDQGGQEQSASPDRYPMPQYPASVPFPGSQQVSPQAREEAIHPRDVELILAKLDAIKSELDALHQRVRKIEQTSDQDQLAARRRYW